MFGSTYKLELMKDFKHLIADDTSRLNLAESIKDLGFILDSKLTLDSQIKSVRSKCIGNLINIAKISKYIDKESRLKLVYGLVLSNLDFCNSLYIDLPNYQLRKLQLIINDAARLVCNISRFSRERVTPVCIGLHFLPIKARIMFKVCLLVHKIQEYGEPSYLADLIRSRGTQRSLRGSNMHQLQEPIIATSAYSNRCFSYSAPRLYNSLPDSVRESESLQSFKNRLKTFLFREAYDTDNQCIRNSFVV